MSKFGRSVIMNSHLSYLITTVTGVMLTTQDFGVLDEYFCGLVFFGEKINFFDKANGLRKMYEWKNNCEN